MLKATFFLTFQGEAQIGSVSFQKPNKSSGKKNANAGCWKLGRYAAVRGEEMGAGLTISVACGTKKKVHIYFALTI